jgi:Protein of unknown function (DUF2934)
MASETQNKRRRGPRRARLEGNFMADSTSDNVKREVDYPDEWVAIAAYYIWKNEGEPDGQDAYYWERAKAELTQLFNEGNLPTGPGPLKEER